MPFSVKFPCSFVHLLVLTHSFRFFVPQIREGWAPVVSALVMLHAAGLLKLHPSAPPPLPPPPKKQAGNDWQWLAGWGDGGRVDEHTNFEEQGAAVVKESKISQVLEETQYLSPESLHSLAQVNHLDFLCISRIENIFGFFFQHLCNYKKWPSGQPSCRCELDSHQR